MVARGRSLVGEANHNAKLTADKVRQIRSLLYVSCWGTGEFIQYDVSDSTNPKKTGSVHLGGIVRRAAHPNKPKQSLNGSPQMVEISRDGKRIYFTNSLYSPWDEQIYPDGLKSWMVKLDADPNGGPPDTFFRVVNIS